MGIITTTQKAGYDSHVIDDAKHRLINDTGTTTTELFSASKIISDLAGKSDTTHNHTGVYEPADATILKDADIGSTVQAYDATILVDADIGSTVQAYNANTTIAGNTFNGLSQLVQTDSTGKLPAIDGSLLTGLSSGFADPMTTRGDVIIRNATNVTARLGVGTNGQVLGSDGTDISWITNPAGVTDHTLLTNIGTNTHAQIDTHLDSAILHPATNVINTFSVSQRSTITTDNDLSFDLAVTNKFKSTPTALGTLTFTNLAAQSGSIILDNTGAYAISFDTMIKAKSGLATTLSTAGIYVIGYECDGTTVYLTSSAAMV